MTDATLPLILEPEQLQQRLGDPSLLIIDLGKAETYAQGHVPGAIFLEYPQLIRIEKPQMGLLPDIEHMQALVSRLGISEDTHVIAYDDEGGGKAGRLLWTLDVIGHKHMSLLNGGLASWANEGFPLEQQPNMPSAVERSICYTSNGITDKNWILEHLQDQDVALLDTRMPQEFSGEKKFSERGGHIPGAVNFNWVDAMDQNRNLRLKDDDTLKTALADLGVTTDKQVIVYCQSHHRSAHTYLVLKHLGFDNVQGYPGAWSDWGNDPNTPIEA